MSLRKLLRNGKIVIPVQRHYHANQFTRSFSVAANEAKSVATEKSGEEMTGGHMYNWRVAAVYNALERRGKGEGPLDIEDLISLGHLDQYHYLGVDACDEVIRLLGLGPDSKVLDIGSGIGGPARYMSKMSGAEFTGVELQADLVDASDKLTHRVGLSDRVKFITGDFHELCRTDLRFQSQFDHFLSLLVFCHFPNRNETLKKCFNAVKPGGTFLIEDLALVGESFTEQETDFLHNVVHAPGVTSVDVYVEALKAAGFVDVEAIDMTTPWKAWTKARHETFRESREETVRLHGNDLFESRCYFYEVIDKLFQGNLGGVKITGRRPTKAEEHLRKERLKMNLLDVSRSDNSVLNEMGDKILMSNGTSADSLSASASRKTLQPLLPAGTDIMNPRFHDSLQYHFFFPGKIVAGRVFHTRTLQQHSAWSFDSSTNEMKELFTPSYETMVQNSSDEYLNLESSQMHITDGNLSGSFVCKSAGVTVNFEQRTDLTWLPAGQNNAVIHRPDLRCTMEIDGKLVSGVGYSKRYYGPYPRHWGYRFIHGVSVDGSNIDEEPLCFWTADACFGDDKYNYYKLLLPTGEVVTTDPSKTYQQDEEAYAFVNGSTHRIKLTPLCTWETIIGGEGYAMDSKMQNRYCEVELDLGGVKRRAVAYNERCYGSVG